MLKLKIKHNLMVYVNNNKISTGVISLPKKNISFNDQL